MDDMTPTDKLRDLLDERGIEYTILVPSNYTAWKHDGTHCTVIERFDKLYLETVQGPLTPEQAIAATVGNNMTLDEATERIEKFMGDYAEVLLESTLYMERDEPTDQHALNDAERKEAQMARDLAEALATVSVVTCHCTTSDDAWCFSCSSCGKSFPRDELHMAHNHGEINYCPNCGRRVIEEVTE